MWKLLEAAHLSKKPGARFNAYDDLFTIRKQDVLEPDNERTTSEDTSQ